MTSPEQTLAELERLQQQAEDLTANLFHKAKTVKWAIKTNPLNADLPQILRDLRRDADTLKTAAQHLATALVDHADAVHAEEMARRPKWKPNRHTSPGQKVRRDMAKRGCVAGDIDAPGFGL